MITIIMTVTWDSHLAALAELDQVHKAHISGPQLPHPPHLAQHQLPVRELHALERVPGVRLRARSTLSTAWWVGCKGLGLRVESSFPWPKP